MIDINSNTATQQYRVAFIRQMQILEVTFARQIGVILNRQFLDAAKYVAMGMDTEIFNAVKKSSFRLNQFLQNRYKRCGVVFGNMTFKEFERFQNDGKKSIVPSETKSWANEFWNTFNLWMMSQGAKKVRQVENTTRNALATIIQKGRNDGLSMADIAKRIRRDGKIAKMARARMIARTEVHTASCFATNTAMKTTRIMREKEWSSSRDARTRQFPFNHFEADGERVGMDDDYTRTGEALHYPGDPRGSGANIINCRCVEKYFSREEITNE